MFCPSQTRKDLRKLLVRFHSNPAKLGWALALAQTEVKWVAKRYTVGMCLITEVNFTNPSDWFTCKYRFTTSLMTSHWTHRDLAGSHRVFCISRGAYPLLLHVSQPNSLSQAIALKVTPCFCGTILILTSLWQNPSSAPDFKTGAPDRVPCEWYSVLLFGKFSWFAARSSPKSPAVHLLNCFTVDNPMTSRDQSIPCRLSQNIMMLGLYSSNRKNIL